MKKAFKILLILTATLLGILVIGFLGLYIKYDSELPKGKTGIKADALAHGILSALNNKAYLETDFISWKMGENEYVWNKAAKKATVKWSDNELILNLDNPSASEFISPKGISENKKTKLIASAEARFNNDSFWIVAPYKIFDSGVERRYIAATETEKASLLITYTNGGTTPGDSYQWFVDDKLVPTKYKMWVSIIPIGGLPSSWEQWKPAETGALLSHKKQIIDLIPLPISNLKTWNASN